MRQSYRNLDRTRCVRIFEIQMRGYFVFFPFPFDLFNNKFDIIVILPIVSDFMCSFWYFKFLDQTTLLWFLYRESKNCHCLYIHELDIWHNPVTASGPQHTTPHFIVSWDWRQGWLQSWKKNVRNFSIIQTKISK